MRRPIAYLIAPLAGLLVGCGHPDAINPAFEKYRLTQTTQCREEITKSIALANRTLSKSVGFQLEGGWNFSHRKDRIPVYVVSSPWLPKADKIYVPEGERFILINAACLRELPILFHESGHSHTNAIMAVGLEGYLSIILLHELGHIVLGHSGSHSALPESVDADLNLVENTNKLTELAADKFAADQIRASPPLDSLEVHLALNNIVWNMNTWRSLEYFGSSELYVPEVYWDEGSTHPNLMLRMLVIADLAAPSELSQQMLKQFVEGRARKQWNKVLRPITSLEEITTIATDMGYSVTREPLSDRTRYHLHYARRNVEFFIDVKPGQDAAGIREIGEAIGLNF